VMAAAERERKLVAYLDAERARLCEAEMVGVARVAPADDARLGALVRWLIALRWRRKFGQTAKVGSPSWKDELYDWKAEAVLG